MITPERLYAEEAAVYLEAMGMPRASGKLLGWLLVCDPPQQLQRKPSMAQWRQY